MKICMVHNEYGGFGGEATMVGGICRLLVERGHEVLRFSRSSKVIPKMRLGNIRAFFNGIHSSSAACEFASFIAREKPDIVQIQNVYPFISPAVFNVSKQAGVPVVFRCANYRLFCPIGLLYSHGEVCDRCVEGKEYWCVLRNCTGSMPKSIGYALRNACARVSGAIIKNTTMYYVPSEFQKRKFITWGIPAEKIAVIPNFINAAEQVDRADNPGDYVAYAGGIRPHKGFPSLLDTARRHHDITFRVAGCIKPSRECGYDIPPNIAFLGRLAPNGMARFYADARMVVMPSVCYETFGMVIIEGMIQGRPVIASRISGIPNIVDDEITGLLFEPGNTDQLASKVRRLWDNPQLCREMGQAGREKVLREYTPEVYYERLIAVYKKAIKSNQAIALGEGFRPHHQRDS